MEPRRVEGGLDRLNEYCKDDGHGNIEMNVEALLVDVITVTKLVFQEKKELLDVMGQLWDDIYITVESSKGLN